MHKKIKPVNFYKIQSVGSREKIGAVSWKWVLMTIHKIMYRSVNPVFLFPDPSLMVGFG